MIVGMNPYFMFNGDGIEATRFYEESFNAEVMDFKTYAELPNAKEGDEQLLLHANLRLVIMRLCYQTLIPSIQAIQFKPGRIFQLPL